jgi:hypothetical protein
MILSLTYGPYESAVSKKLTPSSAASHNANGLTPIGGFAPDSLAGEPHRAQPKPSNEEIIGDQQFAILTGDLASAIL